MFTKPVKSSGLSIIAALGVLASAANAQQFFPGFFGRFGGPPPRPPPMLQFPFAREDNWFVPRYEPRRHAGFSRHGQAYCVRTCDGRYFPLPESDGGAAETSCNSLCPAASTKVMYGRSIDESASASGEPYSDLPNAFRYRKELVGGCSCNGKDSTGLAAVKIENDPTLHKGDIVATKSGLMVARPPDRRGASLNFSPLPARMRARLGDVPVVAAE